MSSAEVKAFLEKLQENVGATICSDRRLAAYRISVAALNETTQGEPK
jgi:hypothetical protein